MHIVGCVCVLRWVYANYAWQLVRNEKLSSCPRTSSRAIAPGQNGTIYRARDRISRFLTVAWNAKRQTDDRKPNAITTGNETRTRKTSSYAYMYTSTYVCTIMMCASVDENMIDRKLREVVMMCREKTSYTRILLYVLFNRTLLSQVYVRYEIY